MENNMEAATSQTATAPWPTPPDQQQPYGEQTRQHSAQSPQADPLPPEPTDTRPLEVEAVQAAAPTWGWLLASSALLMVTWPVGLALFILWAVIVSLSLFAFIAPLLLPLAAAVRSYGNQYRRWAGRVLGRTIIRPSRRAHPAADNASLFRKITVALRDPAIWREWLWLIVNASVGFVLALLPIAFLASGVFHLSYPLLYAVTPHEVFGTVYGIFEVHTMGQAWLVPLLAVVPLGIGASLVRPCTQASARLIAGLIGNNAPTMQAGLHE